jgi:hypothetical protein
LPSRFVQWFDSRVRLDAEAVALGRPDPRWRAGLTALHADFCRWMLERDLSPPVQAEFRHLLEELCLEIRTVRGESFVSNVALKEDPSRPSPEPGAGDDGEESLRI